MYIGIWSNGIMHVKHLGRRISGQISSTPTFDIIVHWNKSITRTSHSMNCVIDMAPLPTVIAIVEVNSCSDVFWKNFYERGKRSFVCLLQLYSDRPRRTNQRNGLTLYPLHVSIFNFTEMWERRKYYWIVLFSSTYRRSFRRKVDGKEYFLHGGPKVGQKHYRRFMIV